MEAAFAPAVASCVKSNGSSTNEKHLKLWSSFAGSELGWRRSAAAVTTSDRVSVNRFRVQAVGSSSRKMVPFANYAVPIDRSVVNTSSFITRPLAEILRDLNKRVPDKVIKLKDDNAIKYIPWYHANRMLSFYAPGWSGELRSISFSPDGKTVTVVYRVTLRGSDGETYREATGTSWMNANDPVQQAEGMAFRRACARFGLGLYLYHEEEQAAE